MKSAHLILTPTGEHHENPASKLTLDFESSLHPAADSKKFSRIRRLLPKIYGRVRFTDEAVLGMMENRGYNLGIFPLAPSLSDKAMIALYIGILTSRRYITLSHTIWPEGITHRAFGKRFDDDLRLDRDWDKAFALHLYPRYSGRCYSPPFEFPTEAPRGFMTMLKCSRTPRSFSALEEGQQFTYHLWSDWPMYITETFCSPESAWDAACIAEKHLDRYSKTVMDEVWNEKETELCEVELFAMVTPRGHAALWLAALGDKRLIIGKVSWPELAMDDVLYFEMFGNADTKRLTKEYLRPLLEKQSRKPCTVRACR